MTIRLPEEKLQWLRRTAAAQNKSANTLVEEAIDAYLPPLAGPSLADVLVDYIGAIDGPRTDSSRLDEAVGDVLKQKKNAGHI